ncbi:MAG TPA: divalent metal cation transporter [Candidatus Moranbacteria bacterium]|nr:divalent metal cation transporter [Candidatus Moranbacteria bacterium]
MFSFLGSQNKKDPSLARTLTLSEFRRELGIPLVLAKKLVVWGEVKAIKALDGTVHIAAEEARRVADLIANPRQKAKLFLRALGPGLITGASDDDPSGIGTYSAVGAKFGLGMLWLAIWLLPMMLAVQEACARIGIVTNKGLVGAMKKYYRRPLVVAVVVLLVVANIVNIGADLGAMAASLEMVSGISYATGAFLFALAIILVEVLVQYHIYVRILKWLTLSVGAYILAGLMLDINWTWVFQNAFIPSFKFNKEYIFALIAVFGTTITPYLFFWQASEEVEEGKLLGCKERRHIRANRIAKMRTDVNTGMILANVVFFFIIVTTAHALNGNGVTHIASAEEAASALRPVAGDHAFLLFALGIIGTGLLAIPILAGSSAYALAELMKWNGGLEEKFSHAKRFYSVIALSILIGLGLNFFQINPIAALYGSAFVNGIIAIPLLVVIMLVGDNVLLMGDERHPGWVRFFGWLSVVAMTLASITFIVLAIK